MRGGAAATVRSRAEHGNEGNDRQAASQARKCETYMCLARKWET